MLAVPTPPTPPPPPVIDDDDSDDSDDSDDDDSDDSDDSDDDAEYARAYLPDTGAPNSGVPAGGLALILVGGVLVSATRRQDLPRHRAIA